ncbi:MAG: hypothetical protein L0287_29485 [Anaerolineae bacterium]|nr:hypothetical protein [Anaerolineae bacterium]
MNKELVRKIIITFIIFLFAASAIGYFIFPASMLKIVGITSNTQLDFLVRTLAAALVGLIPSAWAVRTESDSPVYRSVLIGLAVYMFLSSAVDLHAYLNNIVGFASLPSIAFRILLCGVILWLLPRRSK